MVLHPLKRFLFKQTVWPGVIEVVCLDTDTVHLLQ